MQKVCWLASGGSMEVILSPKKQKGRSISLVESGISIGVWKRESEDEPWIPAFFGKMLEQLENWQRVWLLVVNLGDNCLRRIFFGGNPCPLGKFPVQLMGNGSLEDETLSLKSSGKQALNFQSTWKPTQAFHLELGTDLLGGDHPRTCKWLVS